MTFDQGRDESVHDVFVRAGIFVGYEFTVWFWGLFEEGEFFGFVGRKAGLKAGLATIDNEVYDGHLLVQPWLLCSAHLATRNVVIWKMFHYWIISLSRQGLNQLGVAERARTG
jgi:hypothetical protein